MFNAPTADTRTPTAHEALTEEEATRHIAESAFRTGPPATVGVELEWLVRPTHDRLSRTPPSIIDALLNETGTAPRHGHVTFEPGGALELSSHPANGLAECLRRTSADLSRVRAALDALGIRLLGSGLDPERPPRRVGRSPRYTAMEQFFDRNGRAGRWMMANTASVQICLDAGHERAGTLGFRERWRLAHRLGPVLVAAFANSPIRLGEPAGWKSMRQSVWSRLDPGRTAPVDPGDPRDAWVRYALSADVMMIRFPDRPWLVPRGLSFSEWIRAGVPRRPTMDDLEYHLSTLFPPIRPRGYLELRMVDAQPGDGWTVALAVATALLDDPVAADEASAALEPLWERPSVETPWWRAAKHGLADPELAAAARGCFTAAVEALPRLGAGWSVTTAVEEFTADYVQRGRCPADDALDALGIG
ncbi:ergothioneine biosynthesis glutamate--cysteine ligase EgtA [Phytomonospora endophytica]|uniref:Glutamate--cysteine ligase EgtA n=1 Tax=Phytomonospora endophytica TaxID=714109 RepID=A0A841FPS4_9ACTN|nr:ergothioneine biosynthesis glutamate--cysteine ligase EgtA [Phytomonospora endophytica]MBB6038096.1 glutamate--cysteine ligase [Phytomonospora endophytica]GIG67440.1 glutamate--cysteine ligase EgtA [Phytomonospora endophytica]